jgi:hypothetical protein
MFSTFITRNAGNYYLFTLNFHRAMDIDPTNNYLLTGGFDKNLYIYDIEEEKV